jgi:glutamate synthase domain-containing protein 3
MTGGRAYLYDPEGRHLPALDARSVGGTRLSSIIAADVREGDALAAELRGLLEGQRAAGSTLAARLLAAAGSLADDFWLVEPNGTRSAAMHEPAGDVALRPVTATASPERRLPAAVLR